MNGWILTLVFICLCADGAVQCVEPIVKTLSGVVQGFVSPCATGRNSNAYLGIPYGQPTSGSLRFQLPKASQPWQGVLKAFSFPPSCPQKPFPIERISKAVRQWQIHTPISEDCLKLNIWTPSKPSETGLLPVMVWIHGGGFTRGSTSVGMYDVKCLAAEEDVVVVSINYRVDSFGFLFLDHSLAQGNIGIFDQQLALKWIKRNIGAFGGDPDKVTLFGQSAGGVSVGLHLLFPSSKGLFHRGIQQSGGPSAKWTYDTKEEALEKSMTLVRSIGCDSSNVSEIVQCLQSATVEEILYHEAAYGYDDIFVYTNVIDGIDLVDDPNILLEKHAFHNMDIMTGTVANEGNVFLPGQLPLYFNANSKPRITKKNFRQVLQDLTKMDGEKQQEVEYFYYDSVNKSDPLFMSEAVEKVLSDTFFTCSSNKFSYHYAEAGNKVFNYFFDYRSSNILWPKWVGVPHGEEILYIFGDPLDPSRGYNQAEFDFSRRLMKYWANFAKYGDPHGKAVSEDDLREWPLYNTTTKEHLILRPGSKDIGSHLREAQCNFWETTRPYVMPPRSPLELLRLLGLGR